MSERDESTGSGQHVVFVDPVSWCGVLKVEGNLIERDINEAW